MKPSRLVLPLVLAGVVILYAVARLGGRGGIEAYLLEREALQREMLERSAVARGLAGGPGAEEAREVVRWWFDALAALQSRHPRAAADRPAASPARDGGGGGEAADFERYAKERVDALRAGYAPLLSASEQGLRLDLLAIRAGEHPQTKARALRVDFALWGAPRRVEREGGEGSRPARRVVVPVSFRQLAFRFVDAAGKPYGEMTGAGDPYLALRDPDRFDDALPPGIILGTWWVDAFPREAARVEISVGVQAQGTSAASLSPSFRWEAPVADDWKLRPGETFRAETREVAPEPAPAPAR